ncbi:hypothetical protein CSB68_0794 [Acinetobacter baumannii]|nr:hypothetical protein CSB70_2454 [Acinetobacter baumannii]AVI36853.1 hypothetical protein CSB68_0794 [Acinetobacter baumannii]
MIRPNQPTPLEVLTRTIREFHNHQLAQKEDCNKHHPEY